MMLIKTTGNDSYQFFLVFARMLNLVTLDDDGNVINWITI